MWLSRKVILVLLWRTHSSSLMLMLTATVGPGATLQDNCHIGASCTVYSGETLASQTIVYGADNAHRVEPSYVKPSMYDEQLAHLRRALPSFHTALTL
eukprot:m.27855 g.27855  ORF g.27855 m.27855 type:complete len:98 (+) comp9045_c0_seq2:420-713(+)